MEGDSFVRRLSPGSCSLKGLSGWGEPLALRKGPYNGTEPDTFLCASVMDRGLLQKAAIVGQGDERQIELTLCRPIQPDEGHRLLWWDGKSIQALPVEADAADAAVWRSPLPIGVANLLAMALCYNGERLGARWGDGWSRVLLASSGDASRDGGRSREVAGLLRWFKLPLLARANLPDVHEWATRFPGAFLEAWLDEAAPIEVEGLPWPLLSGADDGADRVVARALSGWNPTSEDAASLAAEMWPEAATPEAALENLLADLRRASPLLMASVAHAWLKQPPGALAGLTFADRRDLLRRWIRALEVDGAADESTQLVGCAMTMRLGRGWIDDNFVSHLLDSAVKVWQGQPHAHASGERNLALAISLQPFRMMLSCRLLHAIGKDIDAWERRAERDARRF